MLNNNRRKFLRKSLVVLSAVPVVTSVGGNFGSYAYAEEKFLALDEKSPQAVALGYVHDAKKSPAKDGQKCATCALLLQSGLKVEGKEGEWGKCALFPGNGLVAAGGWCKSWAPKAS
jgi:High potential iron-sulfur protein